MKITVQLVNSKCNFHVKTRWIPPHDSHMIRPSLFFFFSPSLTASCSGKTNGNKKRDAKLMTQHAYTLTTTGTRKTYPTRSLETHTPAINDCVCNSITELWMIMATKHLALVHFDSIVNRYQMQRLWMDVCCAICGVELKTSLDLVVWRMWHLDVKITL